MCVFLSPIGIAMFFLFFYKSNKEKQHRKFRFNILSCLLVGEKPKAKKEKKIFVNNIKKETKTWYAVCSFFFFFPCSAFIFHGWNEIDKVFLFLSYCEDSEENVTTNMYGKKKFRSCDIIHWFNSFSFFLEHTLNL